MTAVVGGIAIVVQADLQKAIANFNSGANAVENFSARSVRALSQAGAAHGGLNNALGIGTTQFAALLHSGRGATEMLLQGVSPVRILAMEFNNLTYAMSGPQGLIASVPAIARYLLRFAPLVGVVAGVYGAFRLLSSYSAAAAVSVDAATKALAASAAPFSAVSGKIRELETLQKAYQTAIAKTAGAQDDASRRIIANTQAEFTAKKSLLELELKRQQALLKTQQADLAVQAIELRKQIGNQVLTNPDLVASGYADPLVGRLTQIPDSVTGVQKTQDSIDNSPIIDQLKELEPRRS